MGRGTNPRDESTALVDVDEPSDVAASIGIPSPRLIDEPEKRRSLGSSSSLTPPGDTPSREMSPLTTRVGVYNDTVPVDQPFWLEMNPKSADFKRDAYEIDEDEFTVVDITGEIGEGDDILYDVQFEDNHTATVCHAFDRANCYSCRLQHYCATRMAAKLSLSTKNTLAVVNVSVPEMIIKMITTTSAQTQHQRTNSHATLQ
jgi:hypothetical protein